MNKVSGQIEEFFSIGLLFLVNMSKKISLSADLVQPYLTGSVDH